MWVGGPVRAGIFENALDCGAELADAQSIFAGMSGTVWILKHRRQTLVLSKRPQWFCCSLVEQKAFVTGPMQTIDTTLMFDE